MTGSCPPSFADYRDRHRGETILVCGCGRSLATLDHPERFVTIGVNDVGRRFTPDYLVVLNERHQFDHDRYGYVERSQAKAVFTQLARLDVPGSQVVRFRLGRRGDIARPEGDQLGYSNNSPFLAVNLARHLGARRIGLIGVDFTDDHFFGPTGRHPLSAQLARIDRDYAALLEACRADGVELVNLSPISRLESLPRARLVPSGTWATASQPEPRPTRRAQATIAVETKPASGPIGLLLDALAASARALGHRVLRDSPRGMQVPGALAIVWNGRSLAGRGPALFCEHGWLPRSDYQISPRGINADSHAAAFRWDGRPLGHEDSAELDAHLARVKSATYDGHYRYMEAGGEVRAGLPEGFLLVPLQIETDTNILRHAPAHLRTMRALIEHISLADPPWPILFKQHPADARGPNAHLRLATRRPRDRIWPHESGNVHQILKSGACRGIVTINSNVAHDGLLWDVPAIVLGRGVWPSDGDRTPFLTGVPRDWSRLAEGATSADAIACRRAYAHHLVRHQWTLEQARDPERVAALLDHAAREASPHEPSQAIRSAFVPRRRAPPATINVVCENRRWLFEHWKHALAAAGQPGFQVLASQRPLPSAAAWIFIRAAEAARTPDPQRTVVQIHDLAGDGLYRREGARSGVAACAGLSLTHPAQRTLLEEEGIVVSHRRWIMQPVGWQNATPTPPSPGSRPRIAWVGRPARRDGVEISGLADFAQAARRWARLAEVVLIGERLDAVAADLKQSGVACQVRSFAQCPQHHAPKWLSEFDAVVLTSEADAGPWPIFDALRAGVPVIAPAVGWAEPLLADGGCGQLARDADELAGAVAGVLAERALWRQRRARLQERVAGQSFDTWLRTNLDLAADLARPALRQVALA